MHRRKVVLPDPDGPMRQVTEPRLDPQVDAFENLVRSEVLADSARFDHGCVHFVLLSARRRRLVVAGVANPRP